MNYEALKARQRAERHEHHPNLVLRVHRALSWLQRAEAEQDPDSRFVLTCWSIFGPSET